MRFLAERLRVPRGAIQIMAGAAGRRKTVAVDGIDTAATLRLLEAG